jgi:ABC-2 type transport system ATP-binding protein
MENNNPYLEVVNATKNYMPNGIFNINLNVNKGQVIGLLGKNGSGKTTLLKSISGLIKLDEGQIFINGNLKNRGEKNNINVGVMVDQSEMYPNLSGIDNLKYFLMLENKVMDDYFMQVIEHLEINNFWEKKFKQLSLGQRQRLVIAFALAKNPDLILLDEPFNGLDFDASLKFRNLLKTLSQNGKCIIISSHILEYLEDLVTDVVVIENGFIISQQNFSSLKENQVEHLFTLNIPYTTGELNNMENIIINKNYISFLNLSVEQLSNIQKILVEEGYVVTSLETINVNLSQVVTSALNNQYGGNNVY